MKNKGKRLVLALVIVLNILFLQVHVCAETIFSASAECIKGQQVKIHIYMDKDSNVSGIDIFQSDQENGEYQLVGNMDFDANDYYDYMEDDYETWDDYYENGKLDLVYMDTQPHTLYRQYYYQIKAYVFDEDGNKLYLQSASTNVMIEADGPIITYGKRYGKNGIRLKWSKVPDADGYLVYRTQNYDKKSNYIYVDTDDVSQYKLVKTIKSKSSCNVIFKKLMNGVTYTYRVYAYKMVDGKKVLTLPSEAKSILMDYYSNSSETYAQQVKRAFGSEKKKKKNFKTASKASKQMKQIKIKVWDFKNGKKGKKVTRTKWLTVNKRMAPSIKAMFDELYKSKEKQVIHDIGCYSYRYGEHMYGLAIDINPNENYMIDGKKKMAGSFWKPKKNKYSIPLNCEFVRIMERYGFRRGFWGDRKDYMHFSYFGT